MWHFLPSPHEFLDFIMIAHKKKDNLVSKLKEDAVLYSCTNFPIVATPVFEAKAGRKRGFAVYVFHKSVNCLIGFMLPLGRNLLETAVKAGFELVSHFTPLGLLNAYARTPSLCSAYPAPFSIGQVLKPAFYNHHG